MISTRKLYFALKNAGTLCKNMCAVSNLRNSQIVLCLCMETTLVSEQKENEEFVFFKE